MNWSTNWPTEVGYYWYYGCRTNRDSQPQLGIAKVIKISNGVCTVLDGHFLYQAEGASGRFMKIDMPELPL